MEYGQMNIKQIGNTANTDDIGIRFNGTEWDEVGTGVNNITVQKMTTITRLANAATATVAYTGFDFKPKAVIVTGGSVYPSAGTGMYIGFASAPSATRRSSWATNDVQGADSWDGGGGGPIRFNYGGGSNQIGSLASFDSDGMTIDWTLAGTPPASTIQVHVIAFR
jgi:hypothetical protein